MTTLTGDDIKRLKAAGYTQQEIRDINFAKDPKGKAQPSVDLNSQAWQDAMRNHKAFTDKLRADFSAVHGYPLTRDLYEKIVNKWYKMGLRKNPFDWLAQVYKAGIKKKPDFLAARKARINRTQSDLRNKGFRVGA